MRMKEAKLGKAAAQDLTWTAELGQQPEVGVVAWEWLSGAALWHFSELVQHNFSVPNSMKVIP